MAWGPSDTEINKIFWLLAGIALAAFVVAFGLGFAAGRFL